MADQRAWTTTPAIRPDFVPAADFRAVDSAVLEAERLWPRVWQMACRESDLPNIGSFVRYDILDDSILIVRAGQAAGDVVAYYNVCQHRGRELREEAKGQLGRTLACRFHGWQWHIDGSLASVYTRDDWRDCPDFDDAALALPKVQVGRWGGWVWINQDSEAPPLREWLGVVPEMLDPFEPENMRPLWWKTIIAPVGWKVVAEAFNEGYHSWATHNSALNYRNTRQPSAAFGPHSMFRSAPGPFSEYKDEGGGWRMPANAQEHLWANSRHLYKTLGALVLEPGMAAIERLRALPDDTQPADMLAAMFRYHIEEYASRDVVFPPALTLETWSRAGTDWHIFPNSIVLPSLDGALWYRLRPDGKNPDSCIFDIWSFGRFAPGTEPKVENEVFQGFDGFRGQCAFLEEDFANMVAVNRGIKNRGFTGARTNPVQEVPINNFRRVLRDMTGRARPSNAI